MESFQNEEVNRTIADEYSPQQRILQMAANVFAASKLGMWAFGAQQELFYSTCPNQQELLAFLKLGDCLDYVYTHLPDAENGEIHPCPDGWPMDSDLCWNRPVLLSDSVGLIWTAEHMSTEYSPRDALILLGPVFLNSSSKESIKAALRERELSVQIMRQISRMLTDVPVVSIATLTQYIKMMHYSLRVEQIRKSEILCQNDRAKEALLGLDPSAPDIVQKKEDPERIARGEKIPLQAVRTETSITVRSGMTFPTKGISTRGQGIPCVMPRT